jgi:hypothetical protein
MHLISWAHLGSAICPDAAPDKPPADPVLRLLIEAAVAAQPFDEVRYLAANPDVATAIRLGRCPGAKDHYVTVGYFEGRNTGNPEFDEAWYVGRYQDVGRAVESGVSASGLEHYLGPGAREWRSPNAAAEADIARWRNAVSAVNYPAKRSAKPAITEEKPQGRRQSGGRSEDGVGGRPGRR